MAEFGYFACIIRHTEATEASMSSPAFKKIQRAARLAEVDRIKLESGCADGIYCNLNVTLSADQLECDHLPGFTKLFNVSQAVNKLEIPMVEIIKEIGKCDIVCCLCHRARTAQRRKGG